VKEAPLLSFDGGLRQELAHSVPLFFVAGRRVDGVGKRSMGCVSPGREDSINCVGRMDEPGKQAVHCSFLSIDSSLASTILNL